MSQKAKNGGLVPVEVANAIMYFIKAYTGIQALESYVMIHVMM